MNNVCYYLGHPRQAIARIVQKYFKFLPDAVFLKILFWGKMGYKLDLKNPKTFNQKLQWLKIYDRRPEYTTMVDKVAVKDYVAKKVGKEYIIPTLGVWEHFDDIDFDALPDQFVLKTSQGGGSGGVVICRNKATLDRAAAKRQLEESLHTDWRASREWPYYKVPPRILAEKLMTNGYDEDMTDYKFFCFDGEPHYCQVIRDRHSKETIDFYDMEWRHQEFYGLNPVAQNGLTPTARPENLATMQDVCRHLSKGIPFVRVDLYSVDQATYFGELTFYPANGLGVFTPDEWNTRIGDLLNMPTENRGGYSIKIFNGLCKITPLDYELKDYKFFCFNGEPSFLKVDFDRFTDHHANYYDLDWNLLPFGEADYPPQPEHKEEKPQNFASMVELARKLSANHAFLRVDLYNLNGKIHVGELTFFPASGFGKLTSEQWDGEIGRYIQLPQNIGGG